MSRPFIEFVQVQALPWRRGIPGQVRRKVETRVLSVDADTGASSVLVRYPPGWEQNDPQCLDTDEEFFVLGGELSIGKSVYGPRTYAHLPAGYHRPTMTSPHGAVVLTFFEGEPQAVDAADGVVDSPRLVERRDALDGDWGGAFHPQFPPGAGRKWLRRDPRDGEETWILGAMPLRHGRRPAFDGICSLRYTSRQREEGIKDSPEIFLADIVAEIERQKKRFPIEFNIDIARRFTEESAAAYEYLVKLGVEFDYFVKRPTLHTVDWMLKTHDVSAYRTGFEAALAQAGVEVVTRTRAREFIMDGHRVKGVQAEPHRSGERVEFTGTHGVVLASGGYQANADFRRRYQLESLSRTPFLGIDTDLGDGHVMAAALGADLVSMSMMPLLVIIPGALLEDVIAVSTAGHRFHDENGPYDDRVDAVHDLPDQRAFYIFDSSPVRTKEQYVLQMPDEVISAPSLTELADKVGIDGKALVETVDTWNAQVAAKRDDEFDRLVFPADRRGIIEPPFNASRMVVGITFPAGGVRVTSDMEAVSVMGRTIPGLLVVGDTAGGLSSAIGLGGLRITPAVTLGRVAGREAMRKDIETEPRVVVKSLMEGAVVERLDHGTTMMLHD